MFMESNKNHALSPLKTSQPRLGTSSISVREKSSVLAEFRKKMNLLNEKIQSMNKSIEKSSLMENKNHSFRELAEKHAYELTELEEKLSDYNMILEIITLGNGEIEIQKKIDRLCEANEKFERKLSWLKERREGKELEIKSLGKDIEYENHEIQNLLNSLRDENKEEYLLLKENLEKYNSLIEENKIEINRLMVKKQEFENDFGNANVKRKFLKMLGKIRDLKSEYKTARDEETMHKFFSIKIQEDIKKLNDEIVILQKNIEEYETQLRSINEKNFSLFNSMDDEKLKKLVYEYKEKQHILAKQEGVLKSLRNVRISINKTKNSSESVMELIGLKRKENELLRRIKNLDCDIQLREKNSKELLSSQKTIEERIGEKEVEISRLNSILEENHANFLRDEDYLKMIKLQEELSIKNKSIATLEENISKLNAKRENQQDEVMDIVGEYNDYLIKSYKINSKSLN